MLKAGFKVFSSSGTKGGGGDKERWGRLVQCCLFSLLLYLLTKVNQHGSILTISITQYLGYNNWSNVIVHKTCKYFNFMTNLKPNYWLQHICILTFPLFDLFCRSSCMFFFFQEKIWLWKDFQKLPESQNTYSRIKFPSFDFFLSFLLYIPLLLLF